MSEEKEKKRKFIDRIRHRYRLVVMNDDTFEENFSLRLTPLGFFILLASVTIVMTMLVTSIIAFTPIREYIPGYADVGMRRDLIKLKMNSDSLEQALTEQNAFIENIGNVLKGNVKSDSSQNRPDKTKDYTKVNLNASASEEALKKNIESEDKYSLAYGTETKNGIANFFFFTPLKGIVSEQFKSKEQHYGVDIVGPENESVKATLDGTVILGTWSSETGYTITVQHTNNLISVYKHNSVLLKKVGDYVKAGEAIAIIGNSGEQTTGPHLHFELWYNGKAMNPQDYMVF
ncbi:MAG TPA: M23 family metallopeptidase [Bacteroidia bacterium]|jgi:murein DD-endopeptidase MepM/ murein hydrolase activator NlpD